MTVKLPEDVRRSLERKFRNKHRQWLKAALQSSWPLTIPLGIPSEREALQQSEGVRGWITAWQVWQGPGTLNWRERQWRSLGRQHVPDKLILDNPKEVAQWIGEGERWERAKERFDALVRRWPALREAAPRYFGVLADSHSADFRRLLNMMAWIVSHPDSGLYPRQIPVSGLDSKWLDTRRGLVTDLVWAIQHCAEDPGREVALCDEIEDGNININRNSDGNKEHREVRADFYRQCGLKPPPQLVRVRLLDPEMKQATGGLADISAPWEEIAGLRIQPASVFIVENLYTVLAFEERPGSVVIMGQGYRVVDVLAFLPWLRQARCVYWGDIDTHGLAILNLARAYVPTLESILMDEETLMNHRELWVEEREQISARELPRLTEAEGNVLRSLKNHEWGRGVRLEQERIRWDWAMDRIEQLFEETVP